MDILLSLGELLAALVYGLLVLLAKIVLLGNAVSEILLLSLQLLIACDHSSNFRVELNNILVARGNLLSDGHGLLGDLGTLLLLVSILSFEDLQLSGQVLNERGLVVDLAFIVLLDGVDADVHGLLSPLQIFDDGSQAGEVTVEVFVRLNFSSVSGDDPLSDALAHPRDITALDVLVLNLGVLSLLSVLSRLLVLLVQAVALGGLHIDS